ncbi:TRAP-type C4-dicarboxylate transport system permease small subunit [Amorphus suaedae]
MVWLARAVDLVSGFLLAAIALVTFAEASLRYLFAIQIPDAYTLAGYAQAIAIFWGIASATLAGRHITVDLVWDVAGRMGRQAIDVFAAAASTLFLAAFTWMLVKKVVRAHNGFEITSVLHWPIWPFIGIASLGIALACFFAILRTIAALRGRYEGTSPHG